jgi:hypothetical protein
MSNSNKDTKFFSPSFLIFLMIFALFGGGVIYAKYTSEFTHTQIKGDFRDLYFHDVDEYSISLINNNVLKFEKLYSSEKLKVVIIEDVLENNNNWYEKKIKYSRWNGFDENYDNKVVLHIKKQTQIAGGKYKSGKNTYSESKLVTTNLD